MMRASNSRTGLTRTALAAAAVVFAAVVFKVTFAVAQAPQIIRGTVESLDGATLVVKPADGPDLTVKLTDKAQIFGVRQATLADVKIGDFIGVGAMPLPDGNQKAIQVTIFAPSQKGLNEGFRPWDRPGSTMTNATVDNTVAGVDGEVVTVKYRGGEKKIVIGPEAKIRAYVPGDRSELKDGAAIAIYRPERLPDGTLQTSRLNVGLAGAVP